MAVVEFLVSVGRRMLAELRPERARNLIPVLPLSSELNNSYESKCGCTAHRRLFLFFLGIAKTIERRRVFSKRASSFANCCAITSSARTSRLLLRINAIVVFTVSLTIFNN